MMELVSEAVCFGGVVRKYKHTSSTLGGLEAKFSVYLPPAARGGAQSPAVYWLSGLTCTDDNFTHKAGAFKKAAELNLILVMPDTSPRGAGVEGEDESYDFGSGAGFYLNATEDKWKTHYNMYDYVVKELPELLVKSLPVDPSRVSIMGHSMGGHGALTIALKNPGSFRSASAFSPICNPMSCPWGEKAFTGYLGPDKEAWKQYDTCELLKTYTGPDLHFLVDQGMSDNFLNEPAQLQPEKLEAACQEKGLSLQLRRQEGYDHSYYFISTFIDEHLTHHANYLLNAQS